MSELSGVDKLRVLLPHWLEHNDAHISEFKKWQDIARQETSAEAAGLLNEAIKGMETTGEALSQALELIGGAKKGGHQHDHHHH